jgi:transcriptional regulator with XRE-family HTH domain
LRVSKGLTLEKLAVGLGYNAYTIGRWERGDMPPTLTALGLWAEELGVDLKLMLDVNVPFPSRQRLMGGK